MNEVGGTEHMNTAQVNRKQRYTVLSKNESNNNIIRSPPLNIFVGPT